MWREDNHEQYHYQSFLAVGLPCGSLIFWRAALHDRKSERLEGKRLVMDRRARLFTHLGIIFKPDQKACKPGGSMEFMDKK